MSDGYGWIKVTALDTQSAEFYLSKEYSHVEERLRYQTNGREDNSSRDIIVRTLNAIGMTLVDQSSTDGVAEYLFTVSRTYDGRYLEVKLADYMFRLFTQYGFGISGIVYTLGTEWILINRLGYKSGRIYDSRSAFYDNPQKEQKVLREIAKDVSDEKYVSHLTQDVQIYEIYKNIIEKN